ncbi:MAG: hypothetical protein SNJ59_06525 [Aggregatilineales bacterium]
MEFLTEAARFLHSWMRWLFLIVVVIALAYFLIGLVGRRSWDKRGQTLLTIFSSLVGLQWLVGLVLLLVWGSQTGFGVRHYWEHLFAQTVALLVAHLHFRWRRRTLPDAIRYRNGLLLILVTLALVVVGILALPSSIQWRFYIPS